LLDFLYELCYDALIRKHQLDVEFHLQNSSFFSFSIILLISVSSIHVSFSVACSQTAFILHTPSHSRTFLISLKCRTHDQTVIISLFHWSSECSLLVSECHTFFTDKTEM